MSARTQSACALAAAGLLFASHAIAQNDPPNRQTPPTRQDPDRRNTGLGNTPSTLSSQVDQEKNALLATWINTGNRNEIELSRLAQQRAQNAEVKEFAQKMVESHRSMMQDLQAFSSKDGSASKVGRASVRSGMDPIDRSDSTRRSDDATGRVDRSDPTNTGRVDPSDPSADRDRDALGANSGVVDASSRSPRSTTGSFGALDHIALIEQLGAKHLQSAKQELTAKQGAKFDRCYIGMQIAAHMHMADKLEVFQQHAGTELRSKLGESLREVRSHLQEAKRLAETVSDDKQTDDSDR